MAKVAKAKASVTKVGFDGVAVTLNGKRELILSGAVHYPRSTPDMWPEIIRTSKQAGLNTIETYVFWNLHEHQKRVYDFTGRLDLAHFLRLCQEQDMYVILRIGPYICAETNFGGFPPWLIHEPGMVTRTDNEPFKREVLQWCRVLMEQVGGFFATRGGPIILAQLENEYNNVAKNYGDAGKKYMDWVVSTAPGLGIDVPLLMCEGSAEGAIETLNGFSVADRVKPFKKHNPNQPAIWTENWPAWYDTWGVARHVREPEEIAYNTLRFIAEGGTGNNYYMWHGGTNFGREAMYVQCTQYFGTAPLDEYGLPTSGSMHLSKMHHALMDNKDLLLHGKRKEHVVKAGGDANALPRLAGYTFSKGNRSLQVWVNSIQGGERAPGDLAAPKDAPFRVQQGPSPAEVTFITGGARVTLGRQSAAVVLTEGSRGKVLFDSRYQKNSPQITRRWKPLVPKLSFSQRVEPLPDTLPPIQRSTHALKAPSSMLPFTRDLTDYGWYQATLKSPKAQTVTLTLPRVNDVSILYVNGAFAGTRPNILREDPTEHLKQEYTIHLQRGDNRISVLVAAMGLIKGDWNLDNRPMSEEKKGISGDILIDGKVQKFAWSLDVGLLGERLRLFEPAVAAVLPWQRLNKDGAARLRWFKTEFNLQSRAGLGYALTIGKLMKGILWLNGQCLGRYWQAPTISCPYNKWHIGFVRTVNIGQPVQTEYHLPKSWLRDQNTLVIFEETDASPDGLTVVERV